MNSIRPASIDGAQRGDIDRIGDMLATTATGAFLFPNLDGVRDIDTPHRRGKRVRVHKTWPAN